MVLEGHMKIFVFNNLIKEMIFLFKNNYNLLLKSSDIEYLIYNTLRTRYGYFDRVLENKRSISEIIKLYQQLEVCSYLEYTLNNLLKQICYVFNNREYEVYEIKLKLNRVFVYASPINLTQENDDEQRNRCFAREQRI